VYREYRPPQDLAPLVECFWRHELSEGEADASGVVLPDGRVDVVWTAGGETVVAGPQKRSVPRPLTPPFTTVGVRFRPGMGPPLLRVPAHELVDLHVSLAAIDTRPATALGTELDRTEDPAVAAASLGYMLRELADRAGPPDPAVGAASRLLSRPGERVDSVASAVALSDRQLLRRFRESVGYGPKTLHRILRFGRLLDELAREREPGEGLARIASAAGYSDQAHMTRETRELSGLTPAQLARLWSG
jgi:AraC-like DNA-binding protein